MNKKLDINQKYEVCNLLGRTALFTEERLRDYMIPLGIYKYDLREGDGDPLWYSTIEPHVTVNHAGTILTTEPIDFGTDGYISFDDLPEDDAPGFNGKFMSIRELLMLKK